MRELAAFLLMTMTAFPGQYRVIRVEKQEREQMANVHRWISADGDFRAAASWADGVAPSVAAEGVLTLTGQPLNAETVVLDAKTYTFQTVLTDVDGNVLIGGSASDSIDNLVAAITLGAGSGSTYAASMTLHPTVTAAAGAGDTMDVTAKTKGTDGNAIASTETLTDGSFAGATLSGGTVWVVGTDQALFDGSVQTAATTGTDLSVDSDPIGFDLVTTPEFHGDVGGPGNVLRGYYNVGGRATIRGTGRVYLGPVVIGKDEYVVDSPNMTDALTISNGEILAIYVKQGRAFVGANATFNASTSDAATVGPRGILVITLGANPPTRTFSESGLLRSNVPLTDETIAATGGRIEYTGVIGDDAKIFTYGSGTIDYQPPSDVSANTPSAFVFGILDLSKSRSPVTFSTLVIGPVGDLRGEPFVSGGRAGDIDLREDYP